MKPTSVVNTSGLLLLLFSLLLSVTASVQADVFKPAYLQLKQVDAEHYDVLWKVPAIDAKTTLKARPVFPDQTQELTIRTSVFVDGAAVQRWQVKVPDGLEGKPISFSNLAATGIDVLVRVERSDGTEQLERVLMVEPQFVLTESLGSMEVASTYTVLGFEHILIGLDHLLFVLTLILIVDGVRRLLVTITAFTVAHSITLALATLDIVSLPGPPVEALIALSIMFVAVEIVRKERGQNSLAATRPWAVAFAFGLLHGLGFASALAEVGLPQHAVPLALLFFNVGVELGQLFFIACVLLIVALAKQLFLRYVNPRIVIVISAYAIGGMSSFWLFERVLSF